MERNEDICILSIRVIWPFTVFLRNETIIIPGHQDFYIGIIFQDLLYLQPKVQGEFLFITSIGTSGSVILATMARIDDNLISIFVFIRGIYHIRFLNNGLLIGACVLHCVCGLTRLIGACGQ